MARKKCPPPVPVKVATATRRSVLNATVPVPPREHGNVLQDADPSYFPWYSSVVPWPELCFLGKRTYFDYDSFCIWVPWRGREYVKPERSGELNAKVKSYAESPEDFLHTIRSIESYCVKYYEDVHDGPLGLHSVEARLKKSERDKEPLWQQYNLIARRGEVIAEMDIAQKTFNSMRDMRKELKPGKIDHLGRTKLAKTSEQEVQSNGSKKRRHDGIEEESPNKILKED